MKNLLLIASGSGTDARAIMQAWKMGAIPEVGRIILVSTRVGAGCLSEAMACGAEGITIVPASIPLTLFGRAELEQQLFGVCQQYDIGLIFLVGCIVVLPVMPGIPMFNIHPACPILHGGQGMHGLKVHKHVLSSFLDEIKRGKKQLRIDRFFTYPTVHEVTEKPDDGEFLLRGIVEVPSSLLGQVQSGEASLDATAEQLRDIVLPNEWLMLPAAVRMAVNRMER